MNPAAGRDCLSADAAFVRVRRRRSLRVLGPASMMKDVAAGKAGHDATLSVAQVGQANRTLVPEMRIMADVVTHGRKESQLRA